MAMRVFDRNQCPRSFNAHDLSKLSKFWLACHLLRQRRAVQGFSAPMKMPRRVVHFLCRPTAVVLSWGKVMATAADYRKWAEECFEWARAARDDSVREQYASLGRVWLERAARAELMSGMKIAQPEPKTAQKVA